MDHTKLLEEYYDNFNGTSVVLMNDITPKYFHVLNVPNRFLAYTKDRLFTQNTVFYFQKRSVLRELFNQKLLRFQEAGLIQYWVEQYTESVRTKPNRKIPTKLELKSIFGAFQICYVMYSFSCIVFLLELISMRINNVKYFLDFFTY